MLLDSQGCLSRPLGRWLATPHRRWSWFYSASCDTIFYRIPLGWTSYTRSHCATRTNQPFSVSASQHSPKGPLHYTTVRALSATNIIFQGHAAGEVDALPPSLHTPQDSFWCLDHSNIKNTGTAKWLSDGLAAGSLRAVCDGSYKRQLDAQLIAAAVVIESADISKKVLGYVACKGISGDAYRGELLGIYALLSCISYVEHFNSFFTGGSISIGCDKEKGPSPLVAITRKQGGSLENQHLQFLPRQSIWI